MANKLRALMIALLLTAAAASCAAQRVAFYATYSFTRAGNVEDGITQTATGLQNQYGTLNSSGFGGGATLYLFHLPGIAVGLDTRGATRTGLGNVDEALFDVKLSATKQLFHVKPYIGGGGGFMKTRARNVSDPASGFTDTDDSFTTHYDYYQGFAGLDYPLKKVLDVRLIEVGVGSSFGMPQNESVITINSGIVLHF